MKPQRIIGVALALGALGLATSTSALALPSTTVYPAGDSISASSGPVLITGPGVSSACQLNGGTFRVPTSNNNTSGPIGMIYPTRPTFTSCSGGLSVTTSIGTSGGEWEIDAQYGLATPTIAIPVNAITITFGSCQYKDSSGSGVSLGGHGWFNGFTSPANVSSAIAYGGSVTLTNSCGGTGTWTFSTALQTLTDTTNPSSLPLLGP